MANHFKPLTWAINFLRVIIHDSWDLVDKTPTQSVPTTVIETPPTPSELVMEFCGTVYRFVLVTSTGPISIFREEYPPIIKDLGVFGQKLAPSAKVAWKKVTVIQTDNFEQAALKFIQNNFQNIQQPMEEVKLDLPKAPQISTPVIIPEKKQAATLTEVKTTASEVVIGKLLKTEVMRFPDRKTEGKTFENFAIVVKTKNFEKTLQGEGLREALTQSHINIGDEIIVKRLNQILVPLLDKTTQKPVLDSSGQARMTPKWLWSIIKKK